MSTPATRAAVVSTLDGPGAVRVGTRAEPEGEGEVTVRVAYAGVSMPDVLMSMGRHQQRHTLPFTPGCEFAGVVESSARTDLPPGTRVAGLVAKGAFAEVVRVDADVLLPVPDGIALQTAAALPVNYLTMHYALHVRGRLSPGERVLVRGAAGGVGTAAIELARAAGAGEVVALASSLQKRRLAESLGATRTLADLSPLRDDAAFDLVVDPVGGDDTVEAIRRLRQHGRYLIVGFASGTIPSITFNRILLRNIDVIGIYLGYRRDVAPLEIADAWREVCTLALTGRIAPAIDSVRPLEDVAEAMQVVARREARGKVLLRIDAD